MPDLYGYDLLIERFLRNDISASQFEKEYIDLFTNGDEPFGEEIYRKLEWLFFKVDAYTDLPMTPDDNTNHYIYEEQLRACAAETLQEIMLLNMKEQK